MSMLVAWNENLQRYVEAVEKANLEQELIPITLKNPKKKKEEELEQLLYFDSARYW